MSKSLADILKKKAERAERSERPEVDWFSLKDNNPARVRFLQELDPDAPNYDSAKGSALFLVEHVSPQDFRRKAECTMETEGRCFACEMAQEDPRPEGGGTWFQKTNMYIQVFDAKSNKVKVLSRPAPGSFFDSLYEYAMDENEGSLIGPTFKIQKGPGKTDPWTLMETKNKLEVPDTAELVDLKKAIGVQVEYEKQRNFYLPKAKDADSDESRTPAKVQATEDSIDW